MKRLYWSIGGVSLFLAAISSLIASSAPDGLERVSEDLGFSHHAAGPHTALMPDYQIPGASGPLGGAVAGIVGVIAVLALSLVLGRLLRKKTA